MAVLLALACFRPASADDAAPAPALSGLVMIVENNAPGFLKPPNDLPHDALQANFYVFISGLDANRERIKEIRISDASGYGWNVDVRRNVNVEQGTIASYKCVDAFSWPVVPQSLLPLAYSVKMTLTDGAVIESTFNVTPPPHGEDGGGAADGDHRFIFNGSYTGLAGPGHLPVPDPPVIRSVFMDGDSLRVDFTCRGPSDANGELVVHYKYNSTQVHLQDFTSLRDGTRVAWLNAGAPLRTDGSVNTIALPLTQIFPGKEPAEIPAIGGVSVKIMCQRAEGSRVPLGPYLYQSNSGIHRIMPAASDVPDLFLPDAQRRQAAAEKADRSAPLSPAWSDAEDSVHAWEIALPGIYSFLEGSGSDELAPIDASAGKKEQMTSALSSTWGVTDRRSLIGQLTWLLNGGNDARYRLCQRLIQASPGAANARLMDLAGDGTATDADLDFTRRFMPLTGQRGLMAWDLCRLIYLARAGFALGYIDAAEAWKWIDAAAELIRENYDSWRDVGNGFIIGRMYGHGTWEADRVYLTATRAMGTLLAENGLWTRVPWPPKRAADSSFNQDMP